MPGLHACLTGKVPLARRLSSVGLCLDYTRVGLARGRDWTCDSRTGIFGTCCQDLPASPENSCARMICPGPYGFRSRPEVCWIYMHQRSARAGTNINMRSLLVKKTVTLFNIQREHERLASQAPSIRFRPEVCWVYMHQRSARADVNINMRSLLVKKIVTLFQHRT